jgi:hypothetical protein
MPSAAAHEPAKASQAEMARLLQVSRQAINDLIRRNILTPEPDGRLDVDLTRLALAQRVRPSAKTARHLETTVAAVPGPSTAQPTDASISYHIAKTLREVAEARMAQLTLGKMRGELLDAASVRHAIADAARALRDGLANCARRIAADVAPLQSVADCEAVIAREHAHFIASFASALAHMAEPPASSVQATDAPHMATA